MSNKYPYQDGEANTRANRARQRYAHTGEFHHRHVMREQAERVQAIRHAKGISPTPPPEPEASPTAAVSGVLPAVGLAATGTGEAASTGVIAGASLGATALGAGLLASGVVAAKVLNETVLADDPNLDQDERNARAAGRKASYVGGIAGAVASGATVATAGTTFGLGSAGIMTGFTAIGEFVGLGAVAGSAIAVLAPAAAAAAIGYGVYRVFRR